jgi:hypothetical protein
MTSREIKLLIIDNAEKIGNAILKGKDVEIVKTTSGIAIKEVAKKKLV